MWSEAPDEFKEFSQQWGLFHNDSHIVSPYHPEANDLAEKSVKDYSPASYKTRNGNGNEMETKRNGLRALHN